MYKTQAEARAFFAAFKPLVASVDALRDRYRRRRLRRWRLRWSAAAGSAISIAAQDVLLGGGGRVHRRSLAEDAGGDRAAGR